MFLCAHAVQDYGVMLDDDLELTGVRDIRRGSMSEPEPDDQSRTCSLDEEGYAAVRLYSSIVCNK